MVEIELKFQLSPNRKKSVLQVFNPELAKKIRLQAKYYDTPDHLLAKNSMAIRLRQEGEHWVQTFKAAGKSHLERIECEVHLGACKTEPELDLSLFSQNKTVQDLLDQTLGKQASQLALQFKTDVQRTFRVFTFNDTDIEVCLDDGKVISSDQSAPICEVEFELKAGSTEQLIVFTQSWVKKYRLWLDVRSKAERGNLLSIHQKASAATKAKLPVLSRDDSTDHAIRKIIGNCMQHLLPNMAVIADQVAQPEHIHQARVAIRRMRSALKVFKSWSSDIDQTWEEQLASLFRELGTTRDLDVIRDEILPELQNAGAPFQHLPDIAKPTDQLYLTFQKLENTSLFLQLLAFSYGKESRSAKHSGKLKKKIRVRLNKLHRQIVQDAHHFINLEVVERHRTRKRTKRLRYCVEFVSSLYPEKTVKNYLNQLQVVQKKLGLYNDLHVTEHVFIEAAEMEAPFWFAVGWSRAKQDQLLPDCEQELKKFAAVKIFW